jgi:hypothetical protein
MSDINKLILEKLCYYPEDVKELCGVAIHYAEQGLPETSIAEQLNAVVRNIVKKGATQ